MNLVLQTATFCRTHATFCRSDRTNDLSLRTNDLTYLYNYIYNYNKQRLQRFVCC